jgi:hypothetical protein
MGDPPAGKGNSAVTKNTPPLKSKQYVTKYYMGGPDLGAAVPTVSRFPKYSPENLLTDLLKCPPLNGVTVSSTS